MLSWPRICRRERISTLPYLYIRVAAVCLSLCADIDAGSRPDEETYFFTTFCTALVVIRLLFLEIKSALELIFKVFQICNQLLIDFFAAGVRKILRSLLPYSNWLIQIIVMHN